MKKVEKDYGINLVEGVINNDETPIELDECVFKLIRTNYKQSKPTTKKELVKLYVTSMKQYVGSEIVSVNRSTSGLNRDAYGYTLNTTCVLENLDLNRCKNQNLNDAAEYFQTLINDS